MKRKTVDMLHGPVWKALLAFSVPIVLTNWLHMFFNAADSMIAGRWGGEGALASVGATFVFVMLNIAFFGGLATGVTVCAANDWGAGDREGYDKTAHTAVLLAFLTGLFVLALAEVLARPVMTAMHVPADIIGGAVLYLRIYMLCMPAQMVYNSSASLMRARGDSHSPLVFLMIAGASNVVLNMIFVIAFHWGVAGVAVATVMTQYLSAFLALRTLFRRDSIYGMHVSRLRLDGAKTRRILLIGIPAGLQASMLAASDIPLQSSANSLGSQAVAGNAAALSLEALAFTTMEAVAQSVTVFTGQCVGARDHQRVRQVLWTGMAMTVALGAVVGWICLVFRYPLLRLFQPDSAEAVAWGAQRCMAVCSMAFIYGVLAALNASLRGYRISTPQAIINGIGLFGFRLLWAKFYFPLHPDLFHLYLSYPVAWTLCIIATACLYRPLIRRQTAKMRAAEIAEAGPDGETGTP